MDRKERIEYLRAQLKVLETDERREQEERARLVVPKYRFTLTKMAPSMDSWNRIYHHDYWLYNLRGEILNKDELKEVGAVRTFEGAMNYLWSNASYAFVIGVGGGSSFAKEQRTFDLLSAFVLRNPDGGDVTEIINYERMPEA